jgi:hypothetical protein
MNYVDNHCQGTVNNPSTIRTANTSTVPEIDVS